MARKRPNGALTRRLLIGVGAAAVVGVLRAVVARLTARQARPACRAAAGRLSRAALTIPGTRIAAWWLDQGAGDPGRPPAPPDPGGGPRRPCCPGPGCWSGMASRWPSSIFRPTARLPARRSRSAGASLLTSARRWRGFGREAPGRRVGVIGCSLGGAAVVARAAAPGLRRGGPRSGLPAVPPGHREPRPASGWEASRPS